MLKHRTSIEFPEDLWKKLSASVAKRKRTQFIVEAVKEKLSRVSVKAVILCGGEGTRMRPLTLTIPKPMLPLGYKPILEHTVNFFKRYGINDFILAIGYLGETIVKYFGDGNQFDVHIEYSPEDMAMGTGGAIKKVERLVNSVFVVTNGDVVFGELMVNDVLRFHREREGIGTLVLWHAEDTKRFGLVETDEGGRIVEFVEKPKYPTSGWINAGFYVFEPEVFDYIPKNKVFSLESDVFPKLVEEGKLYGYKYTGYWADIGLPKDYERVNKDLLTNKIPR